MMKRGGSFWMQAAGLCVWFLWQSSSANAAEWKGSVNAAALLEVQTTIQLDLLAETSSHQDTKTSSFTGMRRRQQPLSSFDSSITRQLLQETASQRQWVLQVHELLFTDASSSSSSSSTPAAAAQEPSITQLQANVLSFEWKEKVAVSPSPSADARLSENVDAQVLLSSWLGISTLHLLFPLEQQQQRQEQKEEAMTQQPKRTRTLLVKLMERNNDQEESFRFLTQQLVLVPRIKPQQQQDDDLSSWWRPYTRVEMQARSVVNLPSPMQSLSAASTTNNFQLGYSSSNHTTTAVYQESLHNKTNASSYYWKHSIAFGVVVILVMSVRPASRDNGADDDPIDPAAEFVEEDIGPHEEWRREEVWDDAQDDDDSSKGNDEEESYFDDEHEDDSNEEQFEHDGAAHWGEAVEEVEEEQLSNGHYNTAHWGEAVVEEVDEEGHAEKQRRISSPHDEVDRGNDRDPEEQPDFENVWQFKQESTAAQWGDAVLNDNEDRVEEPLRSEQYDTAHWGEAEIHIDEANVEEMRRPSSRYDEVDSKRHATPEEQFDVENRGQFKQESTAQWGDAVLNDNEDRVEELLRSEKHDTTHWGEAVIDVDDANPEEPRHDVFDSEKHVNDDNDPKEHIDIPPAMEESRQCDKAHGNEAVGVQEAHAEESRRRSSRNDGKKEQLEDADPEEQIDTPPTVERCKICPQQELSFVEAMEKSYSEYQAKLAEKQRETKTGKGEVDEGHVPQKHIDVSATKKITPPRRPDESAINGDFVHSGGLVVASSATTEAARPGGARNSSTLTSVACETPPEHAPGTTDCGEISGAGEEVGGKTDAECVDQSELANDPLRQEIIEGRPSIEVWEMVSAEDRAKETSLSSSKDENKASTLPNFDTGNVEEFSDAPQAVASHASQEQAVEINANSHIPNSADTYKSNEAGTTELLECSSAGTRSDQAKAGQSDKTEVSQEHEMARERGFKRSRGVFENGTESTAHRGDHYVENNKSVVVSNDGSHYSPQGVLVDEATAVGATTESPARKIMRCNSSDLNHAHRKEQLATVEAAETQSPDASYTSSLASDSASSEERLRRERHNRIPSNELLQSVMARFGGIHGTTSIRANASVPSDGLPKPHTALSKENVTTMPLHGVEVEEEVLDAIDCAVETRDGASEHLLDSKSASLDQTDSVEPLSRLSASNDADPFSAGSPSLEGTAPAGKQVARKEAGQFDAEKANVLLDAPKDISTYEVADKYAGADVAANRKVEKPKVLGEVPKEISTDEYAEAASGSEDGPANDKFGEDVLEDAPKHISTHAPADEHAGEDTAALDEAGKTIMREDVQEDIPTNTAADEDSDAMAAEFEVEDAEVLVKSPEDMATIGAADGDARAVTTFENDVDKSEVSEGAPKDISTKEPAANEDSGEDTATGDVHVAKNTNVREGAQNVVSTNAAADEDSGTHFAVEDEVDRIEVLGDAAPFDSGAIGAFPDGSFRSVPKGLPRSCPDDTFDSTTIFTEATKKDLQQTIESNSLGTSRFSTEAQGDTQPVDILPDIILSKSLLTAAETIQSDIWEFGEGTQSNPFNLTSSSAGLRSAALRRARRSVSRSKAFESLSSSSVPEPTRVTRSRTKRENEDGTKSGTRSSRRNPSIPEKELLGVTIRVDPTAGLPRRKHNGTEATTGARVKKKSQRSQSDEEEPTRTRANESTQDQSVEKGRALPLESTIATKNEEQETIKTPIEVTSLSKSLQFAAEMMEAPTWSLESESRRQSKATFGKTAVRRAEHVVKKKKSSSTTPALTSSTGAAARKPLSPSRATNVLRSSRRDVQRNDFSTLGYTRATASTTTGGNAKKKKKERPLLLDHHETIDLTFSPDQGDTSMGQSSHHQAPQPAFFARPSSLQQNRPIKRLRRLTTSAFEQTS